jgi:hypothetical protein
MELVCTNPELAREYAESRAVVGPFRRDRIRDCLVPYLHWHPLSGAMHSEGNAAARIELLSQSPPARGDGRRTPQKPARTPQFQNRASGTDSAATSREKGRMSMKMKHN